MRAAFLLHLYYPDVAIELIGRVASLGRADIDLIATYVGPLNPVVSDALDRIPGVVERVEVPNGGWDVGPLFEVLPLIEQRGYDVVCKLHTKKGESGYAAEWRALAYAGTIADEPLVARILTAFAEDRTVSLIGSSRLFKSSAQNQFANAELLAELAQQVASPRFPPADWGFFAGTMFWARTELLRLVADACDAVPGGDGGRRDGEVAHSVERLFGLAPLAFGSRIGLIDKGEVHLVDLPGEPDREPITRTLVEEAERSVGLLNADLSALIARHNPLVDYIQHGQDADALDPNPYFSSTWYARVNADVAAARVHPLAHYLEHGWRELRSTGPLFDGAFYLKAYNDVTGNPLTHFINVGLPEGRRALPLSDPMEREGLKHFYQTFDLLAERRFLDKVSLLSGDDRLVSVIMPAFNRAGTIAAAIRSVLAQSHQSFELIIVDDGSTDSTIAVVESFVDPRIRLLRSKHLGVSAARNLCLANAQGVLIAYLDSDNRWVPWFLDVMLRALRAEDADVGYSAISLRDDLGHLTGYRGAPFDWEQCLQRNWIDLNCLVHARSLLDEVGIFDPKLRRMVDWDLILRLTRGRSVVYAPFVGCDYFDGRADQSRITVCEPAAFEKLVRVKNQFAAPIGSDVFERNLKLSFSIKIAAPRAETRIWGDFHFAEALARSIERLGHSARVDCRNEWTGHELADEDVAITLRGLLPYSPCSGQISFLWVISHPDQIAFDEYDRSTRVFAASPSFAALLTHVVEAPVEPLLQATDPDAFKPTPADAVAPSLLFIGNSRGQDRQMVRWAVEAELSPAVYGSGWQGRIPEALIRNEGIDNDAIGPLYSGASVVLNDHWPSMRAFGIVSNRLFDVAAAGGRAVSDAVPGIASLFGNAVAQVDSRPALVDAVESYARTPESENDRLRRSVQIAERHSFDVRARRLVDAALEELGLRPPEAKARDGRLHVHVIARRGQHSWQSSAYIRLLAPLTDATVADQIRITIGTTADPMPACDVCVVQRTALDRPEEVDHLIGCLGEIGAALVVDVDDAFRAIGADHPEAAFYRPLVAALDRAVAAAAEVWCSTDGVAASYAGIAAIRVVIPNALDPRLWRDWRAAPREILTDRQIRFLYMGTHTHDGDLAHLRPALDRLYKERPGDFHLTLIGIAGEVEPAPWLSRLSPPPDALAYPRFVRWLREQGPFDVGLAPLANTAFNRAKSDIKMLDYAALGLLPIVEDTTAYRTNRSVDDVALFAGDWYATLVELWNDRDRGREIARTASMHVWGTRAVATVAPRLLKRVRALTEGVR